MWTLVEGPLMSTSGVALTGVEDKGVSRGSSYRTLIELMMFLGAMMGD